MKMLYGVLVFVLVTGSLAQDYQDYESAPPRAAPVRLRTGQQAQPSDVRHEPVAILKQINRHNEDGSYTYGYEGADGSFKIETKLATGEVKGKYGYVDETGKVRIVEYGANKYGFQPSGEGITVAPPTLVDESTNKDNLNDYEDEPNIPQQRPQRPFQVARVARPEPRPAPQPRPQPQYVDYEQEQEPEPPRRPQYSAGPTPPRLQIPGAQPVSGVTYSTQQRPPVRPDPVYSQSQSFGPPSGQGNVRISRPIYAQAPAQEAPVSPNFARSHVFSQQAIKPVEEPQPQQPQPIQYQPSSRAGPQPQPIQYPVRAAPQGRSTSVLDQLAKDYALPQGGSQPLHDISFGYY